MPSPFPGMDPYLESPTIWPDVHHELISEIRAALNPSLRPRYVARVELRLYISDDDDPYVSVTEDFGKTWKSLRANLPWGSTRCLREDIKNQNVLYAGTEFAAWASLDRGANWLKINNNLPTVAIHEFAQHPTTGEVVVATQSDGFGWLSL